MEQQKKRNRLISLTVCLLMLATLMVPLNVQMASAASDATTLSNPQWAADGSGIITWDCITFGHYPQGEYVPQDKPEYPTENQVYTDTDGTQFMYQKDYENYEDQYYKIEPIQWRVLQVNGREALLLSDKNLDADVGWGFDGESSWENSAVRSWLNGYNEVDEEEEGQTSFINLAFSQEEQTAILEKTIQNPGDTEKDIPEGNATKDKLFSLSLEEAMNPEYGFLNARGLSNTRVAKDTAYAANKQYEEAGSAAWWQLRSLNIYCDGLIIVDDEGGIFQDFDAFDEAIRPALYLNLDSNVWKYEGQVNSKGNVSEKPAEPTASAPLKNPRIDKNGTVTWDCVYFGDYLQGYDGKGGFRNDPIKWRVLSVNGEEALLLADRNLEGSVTYNDYTYPEGVWMSARKSSKEKQASVYGGIPPAASTWKTCTLRSWMNGYGSNSNDEGIDYSSDNLIDQLFSSEEQKAILEKEIKNEDNPIYKVDGGANTKDKLFLLSISEMTNPAYGFSKAIEVGSPNRTSENTAYVAAQHPYNRAEGEPDEWWLRSPGETDYCASSVMGDGYIGSLYVNGTAVIRPAIYLDLTSDLWKNAGTASSTGATYEEPQPSKPTTPVTKVSQTITAKSFTKTYGNKPFSLGAKAKTKLSYKSSNTKVATVNSAGKVTLKGPGKATITITAAATTNYNAASKNITITVKPKKATLKKAKSTKKRTLKVMWKRDTKATGYQVVIAQNKKFKKGKKTALIKKNKTTSRTFKKLKSRKNYYYKVRAYKQVGKTKLYGAYSKTKRVKVR